MEQNKTQSESISLTLTPSEVQDEQKEQLEQLEQQEEQQEVKTLDDLYSESGLNEKEIETVEAFSDQIDVLDSTVVLEYGAAAQRKVNNFSDAALKNVTTKDLGEVGGLMEELVKELKQTQPKEQEDKGFFGNLFKKAKNSYEELTTDYSKAEANVNRITKILEQHQITLLKDIALLDELYDRNQQNTKELTMYIVAGRKKLKEVQENELPKLIAIANESGRAEDVQAANDLSQACNRFEKKLYDLELTRQVSIQMAPQIRLLQNNDTIMTEKIQSTLVNTIPLWKNQIVLAMGINHSKDAMAAERSVNDMTNQMLKKNAKVLHQATVDTARESERGIIDIETLQETNNELIATLDEVLVIQKEGKQKRLEAEKELARIEQELHNKLLQIDREKDITSKK